jgi:GT2 family glycosyltransferase
VPAVDLSIVTYRPDFGALTELLGSIREQAGGLELNLLLHDNSCDPAVADRLARMPLFHDAFALVDVQQSATNLGFGPGHNANAKRGGAPYFFVLNQDCVVEPDVLAPLIESAEQDDGAVAAWELRQIPYEHPKAYDPVTLDTPWASGAATLFRRSAFDAVKGFDPRIFMYGEDVDLSWRLRARGYRLRYVPRFAVVHRTYRSAGEVKPLQVIGGVQTNLGLRARFGGMKETLKALVLLGGEVLAPPDFAGRRSGLVGAGFRFLRQWPYFLSSRVRSNGTFAPEFNGWNYESRRDGAFVAFHSQRENPPTRRSLVSILIRTVGRGAWLEQALTTVANQTWPNIEAVVVEDGPPHSQSIVESFRGRLNIVYSATGTSVGRAHAGNIALAASHGEWLNFLDDDDLLFADHVEVLMDAVRASSLKGAYALSWETLTHVNDREQGKYEELAHTTRHHQPFNRLALWHHNYFPIQAVLFHRSLYERYGGFAEDMEQLEDWNLWTRYTLEDDFVLVEKTTSKYRVPANASEAAGRQMLLDRAYRDAVERQRALRVNLSPLEISEMAEGYARSQSLLLVSRSDVRRFVGARPWLARLAAWRAPVMRRLRRRRAV